MILSRRHGFIFIKARKVAGTSVEIALSTICGPDDIVTPLSAPDELIRIGRGAAARNYSDDREGERRYIEKVREASPGAASPKPPEARYHDHMRLRQVLKLAGNVAGYRVVGIVRDPYRKALSLANMWTPGALQHYRRAGVYRATDEERRRTLDEMIESGEIGKVRSEGLFRGPDGKPGVDVLLRYERLAEDFAAFVRGLGVESPPELPHAKRGIMADTLDLRRELTPRQIEAINEIFADEFDRFGYERVEPGTGAGSGRRHARLKVQ